MPDAVKVQRGAEGECKERNQRWSGAPEKLPQLAIEIAKQNPGGERQDSAHQRLPREGRQAGHPQRHHGKERTRFERHERICAGVFGMPVLLHERHVEAAVSVVDRGDHRQRGQAGEPAVRDRPLAEQMAERHARQYPEKYFARQQHAAPAQYPRQRLRPDGRAQAYVKHRQDRQRAGEKRAGERAEKRGGMRSERRHYRSGRERDDHHSAGDTLDRPLNSYLAHG